MAHWCHFGPISDDCVTKSYFDHTVAINIIAACDGLWNKNEEPDNGRYLSIEDGNIYVVDNLETPNYTVHGTKEGQQVFVISHDTLYVHVGSTFTAI